jgi:hypothetical protein
MGCIQHFIGLSTSLPKHTNASKGEDKTCAIALVKTHRSTTMLDSLWLVGLQIRGAHELSRSREHKSFHWSSTFALFAPLREALDSQHLGTTANHRLHQRFQTAKDMVGFH